MDYHHDQGRQPRITEEIGQRKVHFPWPGSGSLWFLGQGADGLFMAIKIGVDVDDVTVLDESVDQGGDTRGTWKDGAPLFEGQGALWSLAVVLVVPVLAAEDLGPMNALRRSATLFKKTWGENVGGYLGGMTVVGLLLLLMVLPLAFLSFYLFSKNLMLLFACLATCAIIVLALCAVGSACEMVFKTNTTRFRRVNPEIFCQDPTGGVVIGV